MWDVEASKTTKHYLQTIIKGIQQRCRKCGKPQKKPSNQAIDVQKKRIADTTVANLLLEGCWSESVTQSRRFEIVFPVRKNEANEAIQHQHSIITIGGSIDEETPTFNACCFEFLPDFSHELSAANNGRLLHKDRKHINDQKEGTGILWPTAKEYSLAHVLRVYELDYREKMRLLLHISRALLDLGNTQWLKDDWGINDIRVYEWQKGSSRHLNIRHPFLSLEVPRRPPKAAKRNNKGGRGQPQKPIETFRYYPIALNLSVVIMQVLLGEKLFSHQNAIYRETPYGDQDKLYSPYQKLHQAKELQKLCLTRFGRGWDIMRVVESCLDSQLFMGNDPDEIFREKIVFPLQTAILNDSGYRIEEQSDRSLKTFFEIEDSFTTADTILQTTVAVQVDPPRTSQKRTHEQMDQSNAETLAASPSLEVSSA
jgi:hypothetical protein